MLRRGSGNPLAPGPGQHYIIGVMEGAPEEIRTVLEGQGFAVLSTLAGDQPYTNLVCFAASGDMSRIFFATSRNTRKYVNLTREPRVSLLIDNRSGSPDDIHRATAVTALGVAQEVGEEDRQPSKETYLRKHPGLAPFLADPATVLFAVRVEKYIAVTSLQSTPQSFTP